MRPILILPLLALSACASTTHRHVVGEGVTCPHRSHRDVTPAISEVVAGQRQRFVDAIKPIEPVRIGAATYEGGIDYAVTPARGADVVIEDGQD